MDSCILAHECIDELAEEMGVSERVKDITRRAMTGELDFNVQYALLHFN
jgi:phosphoserine phosphatase